MSIKRSQGLIDQPGITVESAPHVVRNVRTVIGHVVRSGGIRIEKVVINIDATAVSIRGIDAVRSIGVEDIIFDINPAQGLPKNDSLGAIVGDDVIVDFEIADGGVSGDLYAGAAIGQHDVINDDLVFSTEIESMIQTVPGPSVVMNVIGGVNIAAGVLSGIDAVLPLSAGGHRISVVMDSAVDDLIVITPDRDAPVRTVLDLKSVEDVVTAVDVDTFIAVGSV